MFKRRDNNLNNIQRIRKNRQTELFILLDKCTKISVNDKIIIRNQIKQYNTEIINLMMQYKKSSDLSNLQIQLRKILPYLKIKSNQQNESLIKQIRKLNTKSSNDTYLDLKNDFYNFHKTIPQKRLQINFKKEEFQRMFNSMNKQEITESKQQIQKRIQDQIDAEILRQLDYLEISELNDIENKFESINNQQSSLFQFSKFHQSTFDYQNFKLSQGQKNFKQLSHSQINQIQQNKLIITPKSTQKQVLKNINHEKSVFFLNNESSQQQDQLNNMKVNAINWYQQFEKKHEKTKIQQSREPFIQISSKQNLLCTKNQSQFKYGQFYKRLQKQLQKN